MWADRVGGTRCQAVEAPGMGDAVSAGAYPYALSGRLLAAGREGFSLRAGRRVSRRGRVAAGCPGNLRRRKSSRGGACGISTDGFFFDSYPGVAARGLRKSADGFEDSAGRSGDAGLTVTQTE